VKVKTWAVTPMSSSRLAEHAKPAKTKKEEEKKEKDPKA